MTFNASVGDVEHDDPLLISGIPVQLLCNSRVTVVQISATDCCHGHGTQIVVLQVADSSFGDCKAARSRFARAAALHADQICGDAPALGRSYLSSAASDASSSFSEEAFAYSKLMPLCEERATSDVDSTDWDVAPIPDQPWWEKFGEWESAPKVSHSIPPPQATQTCQGNHQEGPRPLQQMEIANAADLATKVKALQHATHYMQPRLVVGDQIIRLPIARSRAEVAYDATPGFKALGCSSNQCTGAAWCSPRKCTAVPGVIPKVWLGHPEFLTRLQDDWSKQRCCNIHSVPLKATYHDSCLCLAFQLTWHGNPCKSVVSTKSAVHQTDNHNSNSDKQEAQIHYCVAGSSDTKRHMLARGSQSSLYWGYAEPL